MPREYEELTKAAILMWCLRESLGPRGPNPVLREEKNILRRKP